MFKTTDKVSRAMDQIVKATSEIENDVIKEKALEALKLLSILHADLMSDLSERNIKHR